MVTPATEGVRVGRGSSRVARRIVVVAVAMLLLGELGVRALGDRLPEPVTWYHPIAQVKVEQMEAISASGTSIDVVLAGTSQMAIGADPLLLSSLLAGHPSVYNA